MAKEPVERIIIGKPMQPNGQPSENLARVQQFVARWKKAQPEVPIEYVDERFTSVLAHRAMIDGGLHKKARQDKALRPCGSSEEFFSRLKPFLRLASLI